MFLNVVLCCVWNIEHCVGMTTRTQLTQLRDIYRQAQLRLCKLGPGTRAANSLGTWEPGSHEMFKLKRNFS